jgi:hypothetical protein
MGKHTVEIGDDKGNSFKITVDISYSGVSTQGSWRSLDKGSIRYNSGVSKKNMTPGTLTGADLYLYGLGGLDAGWGLKLNEWDDIGGVNDQGTGTLQQAWVLGASAGKISWALAD